MRFASLRNSTLSLAVFIAGIVVGAGSGPVWKLGLISIWQQQFGNLTYKCDHAMREHLVAKQTLTNAPSKENVTNLEAAELALIDCQDYDLLRKRLILWGLTDNELSMMSLKAIEEKGDSLQKVIEIHEIRY